MNELKVFEHSDFGELGVLLIDGREYFPATACAKILGYANPQEAIRTHCKGVRKTLTPSKGGQQKQNYIPEGDLYRLIIRSKLPAAERFERWVMDEVLPTIRKQGAYIPKDSLPMEKVLEIIQMTATAVVAEVVRQIVPLIRQQPEPTPVDYAASEIVVPYSANRCKLETFPQQLRQQVDSLIDEMLQEQSLNFSRIARYCTLQGHPISSPSVKRYFERRTATGA